MKDTNEVVEAILNNENLSGEEKKLQLEKLFKKTHDALVCIANKNAPPWGRVHQVTYTNHKEKKSKLGLYGRPIKIGDEPNPEMLYTGFALQFPNYLGFIGSTRWLTDIVGRDSYIEKLNEIAKEYFNMVVITGLGGMGKTKTAELFGARGLEEGLYDHVYMISVDASKKLKTNTFREHLVQLANNRGDIFSILKQTNDDETYGMMSHILKTLPGGKKKLLILDDVTKEWLKENRHEIQRGVSGWDILATSRDSSHKVDGFTDIPLENLSPEFAYQLFTNCYKRTIDPNAKEQIEQLIDLVGGHALSISALAKVAREDWDLQLPGVIAEIRTNLDFKHSDIDAGDYEQELSQAQIGQIIKTALNLDKLEDFTESQQEILKHFSVLPSEFVEYKKYKEILEPSQEESQDKDKFRNLQTDFDLLVKHGFLERQGVSFKMHKIVQLAIRNELKVDNQDYNFLNKLQS